MPPKKAAPEAPTLNNIYEAINWIMSQVGYVQKKRTAGLNYSFAGEVALIQALRPYMVEAGVIMYVDGVSNVTCREYVTGKGTPMTDVSLDLTAKFTHAKSGTSINVSARGQGADTGDKATNKASTCAYKYILRQTFCIETGDDPDEFASTVRKAPATATVVTTTPTVTVNVESLDEAKARLTAELSKELPAVYPDRAAIGAVMKANALKFEEVAQYADIKTKLVALAPKAE